MANFATFLKAREIFPQNFTVWHLKISGARITGSQVSAFGLRGDTTDFGSFILWGYTSNFKRFALGGWGYLLGLNK